MSLSAWYQCARGCSGRYSVFEVIYRCPQCGGLLEVCHDEAALGALHTGSEWRAVFDERGRAGGYQDPGTHECDPALFASGVWSKHEWVLPEVPAANVVTLGEGFSPLLPARRLGRALLKGSEGAEASALDDLWIKECGISHTGSFKDLGMTVLASAVMHLMRRPGSSVRAVACASTGDTSAALAAYAAAAGIPAIVFLPRGKISTAQLIQPISNGAHVLALDTDFDGCMRIVREVTQDHSIYLANSMNSLRIEGQKTVGIEIAQQLGWRVPDWIILPSGNLGNISALAKGLTLAHHLGVIDRVPRLAAAQAERANPLYQAYRRDFKEYRPITAGPTAASAIRIGDPVSYEKAVAALQACNGVVEQASEDELAEAVAHADLSGFYACPHTGVALAAAARLARQGVIRPGERVVVISTAHGLKFTDFKIAYHEGRLADVDARQRNPIIELPANAGVVRAELEKWLAHQPLP